MLYYIFIFILCIYSHKIFMFQRRPHTSNHLYSNRFCFLNCEFNGYFFFVCKNFSGSFISVWKNTFRNYVNLQGQYFFALNPNIREISNVGKIIHHFLKICSNKCGTWKRLSQRCNNNGQK